MSRAEMSLEVPSDLHYRYPVLEFSSFAACSSAGYDVPPSLGERLEDPWVVGAVSAVSEVFTNLVQYGTSDSIRIDAVVEGGRLTVKTTSESEPFTPSWEVELPAIQCGGLGLFIARQSLDSIHYTAGPPTVWTLVKQRSLPIRVHQKKADQA